MSSLSQTTTDTLLMTDIFMMRIPQGLMPAHASDEELLKKIPIGRPINCKITQPRNIKFFRKYWAMMHEAFDLWVPQPKAHKLLSIIDADIQKNFDRFRDDITILTGHYIATYRLNGDVRYEAKSIAWKSMSEDEFAEFYTHTIDILVEYVQTHYTDEQLRNALETIEAFE